MILNLNLFFNSIKQVFIGNNECYIASVIHI